MPTPSLSLPCLSVINRLMQSPEFGLTQIYPLSATVSPLQEPHEVKKALTLLSDEKNQLPTVFFTTKPTETTSFQTCNLLMPAAFSSFSYTPDPALIIQRTTRPQTDYFSACIGHSPSPLSQEVSLPLPPFPPSSDTLPHADTQQIEQFAEQTKAFCRTVLLEDSLTQTLGEALGQKLPAGSLVVVQPVSLGGGIEILPHPQSRTKYKQQLQELAQRLVLSSSICSYSFGEIYFLQDATALLSDALLSVPSHPNQNDGQEQNAQRIEQLKKNHQEALKKRDRTSDSLTRQIDQLKAQVAQMTKEKEQIQQQRQEEKDSFSHRIKARDEEVAYLRRALTRPSLHTDIVTWARTNFSDRLFMHSRTEGMLSQNSARGVDLGLICDALDFLATDYWEARYNQLPEAEMRQRCSEKYHRPFDATQINALAIQMTPREYKVKYLMTGTPKAREYALDWHVGVGSGPETLLRIYFFHDDAGQKIIVGSLPHHLTAVKLQ